MPALTPSSSPITPGSGALVATFTDGSGKLYQGIVLLDQNGMVGTIDVASGGLIISPYLIYNSSPTSLANGQVGKLQLDQVQNLKVSVQSQFTPQQDGISAYAKGYKATVLTGSGQILSTNGVIAGWHVNTLTVGSGGPPTMQIADNTTNAASGFLCAPFTPELGPTTFGPCEVQTGGYATIVLPTGAAINITFFTRNGIMA